MINTKAFNVSCHVFFIFCDAEKQVSETNFACKKQSVCVIEDGLTRRGYACSSSRSFDVVVFKRKMAMLYIECRSPKKHQSVHKHSHFILSFVSCEVLHRDMENQELSCCS